MQASARPAMDRLDLLEAKSIATFREAYSQLDRQAML